MTTTDIGLVVLDWAGTVIDFGCLAPAGAFQKAFADDGVDATIAEVRAPMGLHKKDHIRVMLQQAPLAAKWLAAKTRPWTEADVEALYRRVTPLQVAAAREYSTLVPGVLECVAQLRALNVKIAGSTGYFHEAMEVCAAAGRRQGFAPDFNIGADDVPAGRPKPWMIFRCMEALDVFPPRRVVKVGDTVIDIEDGLNAGVWSVAVVESSSIMGLSQAEFAALSPEPQAEHRARVREEFEAAGADAVLNDLSELPDYVRDLNRKHTDSL